MSCLLSLRPRTSRQVRQGTSASKKLTEMEIPKTPKEGRDGEIKKKIPTSNINA